MFGTWARSGSPYLIQGSIFIPQDSTLIIEPGVTLIFNGTYKLLVKGQLLAIGTLTDSIRFTATDTQTGWRGVRFDNTPAEQDSSILDYCSLQYGKARGSGNDAHGGAIFTNNFSGLRVSHCRIAHCMAYGSGGGICVLGTSSPSISQSTFSYNSSLVGGAIAYDGSAESPIGDDVLIVTGCIITTNDADNGGGGICSAGRIILTDNTITGNNGGVYGGGIRVLGASATITNNIISYNTVGTGYVGGGIYCETNATISSNTISNNSSNAGGGVFCENNSNTIIINNIITNNSSSGDSEISGGGGVYVANSAVAILTNNTICNNAATGYGNGGGVYCRLRSSPTLRNCILYGNTATNSGAQVYMNDDDSDPDFYYCDIQDSTTAFGVNDNFYLGTYQNNIDADPRFISPSGGSGIAFDGVIADWTLQSTSPCINTGDPNGTYPFTDRAGNPRVIGSSVDIGAYEYTGQTDVNEELHQKGMSIYPNPGRGQYTIKLNECIDTQCELQLFDVSGSLVESISTTCTDGTIPFEITAITSGVYIVVLHQNGTSREPIAKQLLIR